MEGFPGSSAVKESACNAGDPSSIPGLGRSPGEEIGYPLQYSWAFLVSQMIIYFQCVRLGFDPWVGKIPWRRSWQPTPVFLPGESLWTELPGGLQSMGSQKVGHNWATKCAHVCTHTHTQKYCSVIKKWRNSIICDNMNGPWGHVSKWNKPEIKSQILHGITCMWSLKKIFF